MAGILLSELLGTRSALHNRSLHSIHSHVGCLSARRGRESGPSLTSNITKRRLADVTGNTRPDGTAIPEKTVVSGPEGEAAPKYDVRRLNLHAHESGEDVAARRYAEDADVLSFLKALREGDSFKLYLRLLRLVSSTAGPTPAFAALINKMPKTTYSAILQCFDPFVVCKEIDSTQGVAISERMCQNTLLGHLINKWGVKIIYIQILNRLRHLYQLRRERGHRLLIQDYTVLIRCAGAASDIMAARRIWYDMETDKVHAWRDPAIYSEFVKVRYLTEELYASNDLARFRVRPLNLHRSKLRLPNKGVTRLKALVVQRRQNSNFRFGQDMRSPNFAEDISRVLRRTRPLQKLTAMALLKGWIPGEEKLTCSLMKAQARAGGLFFCSSMLKSRWGITMEWDTGEVTVAGGNDLPPDSPAAPTAHLLATIVHCYGSNAEILTATRLVDFISRRYEIPVPDKVWSDLLQYTYIAASKPASTEWRYAGISWRSKRPDEAAVQQVWDKATAEPYKFKPGIRDYHNLVRAMVSLQRVPEAIEAMYKLKPLYDDVLRENEETWVELVETTHQGVDNHACYKRFKALEAKKAHIWYCFEYQCLAILQKVRIISIREQDKLSTIIPRFVLDFANFMPPHIRYRTSTGHVSIRSDQNKSWADFGYRLIEVPAQHVRPPFSRAATTDPDVVTLQELEDRGQTFTGFHGTPRLVKYAARREWQMFRRPASGAWDFQSLDSVKLEKSLLRAST